MVATSIIHHAVVVPYLTENWKYVLCPVYEDRGYLGYMSPIPKATDPAKHTYFGRSLFVKSLFDFHNLRVLDGGERSVSQLDPSIGMAWVSSQVERDSRGMLLSTMDLENDRGAYGYYPVMKDGEPRKKGEVRLEPSQSGAAKEAAGVFTAGVYATGKLRPRKEPPKFSLFLQMPPDFKENVLQYSCAPLIRQPHTARPGRALRHHCKNASDLSRTCRYFEQEVRAHHLSHNVLLFYDSVQLERYLGYVTPKTTIVETWPWRIQHIIIDIRTANPDVSYLSKLLHTTVIPLSTNVFSSTSTSRSIRDPRTNQQIQPPRPTFGDLIYRSWLEAVQSSVFSADCRLIDHATRVHNYTPPAIPPAPAPAPAPATTAAPGNAVPYLAQMQPLPPAAAPVNGPIQANAFFQPAAAFDPIGPAPVTIEALMTNKAKQGCLDRDGWIAALQKLFETYNDRVTRLDVVYDSNTRDWRREQPHRLLIADALSTRARVKVFQRDGIEDEKCTFENVAAFVRKVY